MNIDNRQNIKSRKETCNHNYKDITNTLTGVLKLRMVSPNTYYLQCKICGDVVSINRDDITNIREFIHTFF